MDLRPSISVDLNVRVNGNETYAGLEDVRGIVQVGSQVVVSEPESGLAGNGVVSRIDMAHRLVFIAVDWSSLKATD